MLEQVLAGLPNPITRVVLQNGLALTPTANSHEWLAHAGVDNGAVYLPLATCDGFALQPLLVDVQLASEISCSVILSPTTRTVQPGPALAPWPSDRFVNHRLSIDYLLDALPYHFNNLTRLYQRVCDHQKETTFIVGFGDHQDVIYSGNPEAYYEFDAMLGVARRSYGVLSDTLAQAFGPLRGVSSRDFPAVVEASALDGSVAARLLASWTDTGRLIKDYRDCIHHFTPIGLALSPIHMHQIHPGVWTAAAYIPDNPEVKSRRLFTFARRLDALDFAWGAVNEVREIAAIVLREVQRVSA